MSIELTVPEVGESIQEVQILEWKKHQGDWVEKDEDVVEIETDKATVAIPSPLAGRLVEILKADGEFAEVGDVIALLEKDHEGQQPEAAEESKQEAESAEKQQAEPKQEPEPEREPEAEQKQQVAQTAPAAKEEQAAHEEPAEPADETTVVEKEPARRQGRPAREAKEETASEREPRAAERPAREKSRTAGNGKKRTGQKSNGATSPAAAEEPPQQEAAERRPKEPTSEPKQDEDDKRHQRMQADASRGILTISDAERREQAVPMSILRRTIGRRLVEAQQNAALLTTFNEIDMRQAIDLRRELREEFREQYDVKLGFMSLFVKAVVESLKHFPELNAEVRGNEMIYRSYADVGIAIGSERGLVVPVLRDCQRLSFAEIERQIDDFADRAAAGRLDPAELEGGTFTITNGGIYGSLLSTPIVNPPQSGVLGMHAIQERPVARDGEVVIRPMMYVALTYDHRVVDGREAVGFLRHVKEIVELPERLLLEE